MTRYQTQHGDRNFDPSQNLCTDLNPLWILASFQRHFVPFGGTLGVSYPNPSFSQMVYKVGALKKKVSNIPIIM